MYQRSNGRVTDVDEKWCLPQSPGQLREDDELVMQVRILGWSNCAERPKEIRPLVGKPDVSITKVKRFGDWND
jgi:hypothetical protein